MARTVLFDGIGEGSYVTFLSALVKHTDEDKLVYVSANGTVALCAEDAYFFGVVRVIDDFDKSASVQIDGFVTMSFDPAHSDPALGWNGFTAGVTPDLVKVTAAADGKPMYWVVSFDATNHTVTFKLDPY